MTAAEIGDGSSKGNGKKIMRGGGKNNSNEGCLNNDGGCLDNGGGFLDDDGSNCGGNK